MDSGRNRLGFFACMLVVILAVLAVGSVVAGARASVAKMTPRQTAIALMSSGHHRQGKLVLHGHVTSAQRAAAARAAAKVTLPLFAPPAVPVTSTVPDYWGTYPNWANSPLGLRKFVDALPNLVPAMADKATFAGSDYYELAVVEFSQKLHTDLANPTTLRGYVQLETAANAATSAHVALTYPGGAPILNNGAQVYAYAAPTYLGPMIVAQRGTPVRIRLVNYLRASNAGGNLFLPVDTTMMGAGTGPNGAAAGKYPQNRTVLHLHGGDTVWISDGTPNQWITPAGEPSVYKKGVSEQSVPDMRYSPTSHVALGLAGSAAANAVPGATMDPGPGSQTYFYTNNESARLMWFHDHSLGMTRLNVYAGEAGAYLLQDTQEAALTTLGTAGGGLPADQIPMVIQDKTFLPNAAKVAAQDPTWKYLPGMPQTEGSLWFPHVYMTNQNPYVNSGAADMGRWDYGPWFWPVFGASAGLVHGVVPNIYAANGEPAFSPGTPNPSLVPESFMDTMMVNGKAYPYKNVDPKPYRLRILNACNDRYLNLQLYTSGAGTDGVTTPTPAGAATAVLSTVVGATDTVASITGGLGGLYSSAPGIDITPADGNGGGAQAEATLAVGAPPQPIASINVTSPGSGFTVAPNVTIGADTEVKMVQACPDNAYPSRWPTDGRAGGVPDPATVGPDFIQVGTEGGFLPAPVDLPNTPVGYNYNRRDIVVLNVQNKTLFLGPAERADAVVDFSAYAGKTVILYNDGGAPVPAFDPRNDYYTGDPDQRAMGGAPSTLVGQGPSTRTVMVFKVAPAAGVTPTPLPAGYLASLTTNLGKAYTASQPKPIVPQATQSYPAAYSAAADTYSRIQDNALTFTPVGATAPKTVTLPMQPKTIQELFEMDYGRMNATLGVELPFTNSTTQTTIPLGYMDPLTETLQGSNPMTQVGVANDGTQIWKITQNGVDTHVVHFHLFNVQLINRVGWDGAIRPPDPNEVGWKESVRMNPLEDCIVAMRPVEPVLPFKVGDSIRPMNPTMPVSATMTVTDPTTGNPMTMKNDLVDYGWEYVWHCHLLGHEENDFMRAVDVDFSPNAPTKLNATAVKTPLSVSLTWTGNAAANPATTQYVIQRSLTNSFATGWTSTVLAPATRFTDTTVVSGTFYYYRVRAENVSAYSAWSNIATVRTSGPLAPANVQVAGAGVLGARLAASPTSRASHAGKSRSIKVTWTNRQKSGATSNRVQYSTKGSRGPWKNGAVLKGTATKYKITHLRGNTKYWIRVVARNVFGSKSSKVIKARVK